MRDQIIETIQKTKIVAILRKIEQESLISVAEALYEGGIRALEIAMVQDSQDTIQTALNQIELLSNHFKNRMFIGAGTVMSEHQVELANKAGATFSVSPNYNEMVIKKTLELDMVSIPGAMTPSEIVQAYEWGGDFIKVFPAKELGPDYFKTIKAPLSNIPLMAVGSITEQNIINFKNAGVCGYCIGGKLANKEAIANKDYAALTAAAVEMLRLASN